MKNEIYLALAILAIIPASAQNAPTQSCPANDAAATTVAQDYAGRVDGLLRDIHASLQEISERMEAGRLTPQQAQALKLAATRDMIARLDTMSALYDAKLAAKNDSKSDAALSCSPATTALAAKSTVSVKELQQEVRR